MGDQTRTPPVRTCIGCRRRTVKSDLVRIVARGRGVLIDHRGVAPGRGAYLHRSAACVDLAVRRRAFGRALRAELAVAEVADELRAGLEVLA